MTDAITLKRETIDLVLLAMDRGHNGPNYAGYMATKDALRAALQQAEPQARAGEPNVVWVCCVPGQDPVLLLEEPSDEQYPPGYKDAYVPLQSHREAMKRRKPEFSDFDALDAECESLQKAIAEKDAALTACVEALQSIDQQIDLAAYPSAPGVTLADELRDAITQAHEQLK